MSMKKVTKIWNSRLECDARDCRIRWKNEIDENVTADLSESKEKTVFFFESFSFLLQFQVDVVKGKEDVTIRIR